jgi:hypothetical protein
MHWQRFSREQGLLHITLKNVPCNVLGFLEQITLLTFTEGLCMCVGYDFNMLAA